VGREILADNPDHPGSLGVAISEAMEEALENDEVKYSLGSVLNHVMLHQTVIGQELKTQLEIAEETPDVMIACAGGGSNLAGSLFPFIKDKIDGNSDT
jgi:tryptophan synthase beta chain